MWRSVLAILAGLVIGVLVVAAVEWAGHQVFPPPANLDFSDSRQWAAYMQQIPPGALIMVLVAWFFGACDAAIIAAWLAPSRPWLHAMVVVGLQALFALAMLVSLAHPTWFMASTPAVYLLAWLTGSKVGSMLHDRRRAGVSR